MRTAFILSSGRTGTKFLAHYLDANFEQVHALHEPPPARLLRVAAHGRLAGGATSRWDGWLVRLLERKRRAIEAAECELYVESNPFLATAVDALIRVFPDTTIVHVVRDARDYVRSALNHGIGSGLKASANRWLPFWYPDVATPLDLAKPLDWLETAAAQWTLVNQILEAQAPHARAYHRIAYEHLFADDNPGLADLERALSLEAGTSKQALSAEARINAGKLDVLGPWREWDARTRERVEALCGESMRRYGYGNEPEWRAPCG